MRSSGGVLALTRLLVLLSTLALTAACSTVEQPTPSPEPTPVPTDTPTPAPPTEQSLGEVCRQHVAVPTAAEYAGVLHPLVVFDNLGGHPWAIHSYVSINLNWLQGKWKPGDIQLVVCEDVDGARWDSVGTCKNLSGHTMTRRRFSGRIDVYRPKDGAFEQYVDLQGSIPPKSCSNYISVPGSANEVDGDEITATQLNTYATAVSKQKIASPSA